MFAAGRDQPDAEKVLCQGRAGGGNRQSFFPWNDAGALAPRAHEEILLGSVLEFGLQPLAAAGNLQRRCYCAPRFVSSAAKS